MNNQFFYTMENNNSAIVNEIKTEDFNPNKHLLNVEEEKLMKIKIFG